MIAGFSREGGLPSFLHGPGESQASSGDGKGVTSPMAEITGLGYVELAAEEVAKKPPWLPVLRLGVLEIGLREAAEVLW